MEPEIIEGVAIPEINVSNQTLISQNNIEQLESAKPENITKISEEILGDIRESDKKIDDLLESFINMVMNEGDASGSSKEAVVNLVKAKSDLADKKIKVMDLCMRAYLKDNNTFPKYLAVTQNNKFNGNMRSLIKSVKEENVKPE